MRLGVMLLANILAMHLAIMLLETTFLAPTLLATTPLATMPLATMPLATMPLAIIEMLPSIPHAITCTMPHFASTIMHANAVLHAIIPRDMTTGKSVRLFKLTTAVRIN